MSIRIASPTELSTELRRLLDYSQQVTPSRHVLATKLRSLAERIKTAAKNKKFDGYIALATDDVKDLRKSDVFRVLSEAKSAKELKALSAYLLELRPDLKSTVEDDAKDVGDEKCWK
jgi:hypothetical protein